MTKIHKITIPLGDDHITKIRQKAVNEAPWGNSTLFSQWIAFHPTEKILMKKLFKVWLDTLEEKYPKSCYIELMMFIRREPKKTRERYTHNISLKAKGQKK